MENKLYEQIKKVSNTLGLYSELMHLPCDNDGVTLCSSTATNCSSRILPALRKVIASKIRLMQSVIHCIEVVHTTKGVDLVSPYPWQLNLKYRSMREYDNNFKKIFIACLFLLRGFYIASVGASGSSTWLGVFPFVKER